MQYGIGHMGPLGRTKLIMPWCIRQSHVTFPWCIGEPPREGLAGVPPQRRTSWGTPREGPAGIPPKKDQLGYPPGEGPAEYPPREGPPQVPPSQMTSWERLLACGWFPLEKKSYTFLDIFLLHIKFQSLPLPFSYTEIGAKCQVCIRYSFYLFKQCF